MGPRWGCGCKSLEIGLQKFIFMKDPSKIRMTISESEFRSFHRKIISWNTALILFCIFAFWQFVTVVDCYMGCNRTLGTNLLIISLVLSGYLLVNEFFVFRDLPKLATHIDRTDGSQVKPKRLNLLFLVANFVWRSIYFVFFLFDKTSILIPYLLFTGTGIISLVGYLKYTFEYMKMNQNHKISPALLLRQILVVIYYGIKHILCLLALLILIDLRVDYQNHLFYSLVDLGYLIFYPLRPLIVALEIITANTLLTFVKDANQRFFYQG